MECEICLNPWNIDNRIPKLLSCGHTFCLPCLKEILSKSSMQKSIFKCPSCKCEIESISTYKDLLNLQNNNALLSFVNKIETPKLKTKTSAHSVSNQIKNNISYLNNETYNDIIQNLEILNFNSKKSKNNKNQIYNTNSFFPICQIHKRRAHFYIIKDNKFTYICNDCLQLEKYEKLYPLQNLKIQNKYKINSCKNRSKLLKEEIKKIENFLKSYQDNFENENNKKIKELFDYIQKIVMYNITTAKTIFNQCKKEQKMQIDKKMEELNFLRKELNMFDEKLDELYNLNKDIQLPESQIELDHVYNKLGNYINYENELNLFTININIIEEAKGPLFDLIQNLYKLDIDFLKKKNGELPTIKDLLNKSISWPCKCGNINNKNGEIVCNSCSKYRPLETYKNILFNPMLITKTEQKEYHIRRKHELKAFQSLMKKHINYNNYYFAIDSSWFNSWKCFISNDLSEKTMLNNEKYISENKSIGVLPPGKIDNIKICDISNNNNEKYKLKEGLEIKKDYIIVNQLLWEWLLLNYEGGPEIIVENNIDCPSFLLTEQENKSKHIAKEMNLENHTYTLVNNKHYDINTTNDQNKKQTNNEKKEENNNISNELNDIESDKKNIGDINEGIKTK